jgi:LacI family transcriptional regulator
LARERREGFLQTLSELGVNADHCSVREGNWECHSGYLAMQQLLAMEMYPTAIFTANDRMAIGAICAAEEIGLKVPKSLSVVALDDIEVAAYQHPPLTTIRQPFADMATLAIELLLKTVMGSVIPDSKIIIDPQLIVRQSTMNVDDAQMEMKGENAIQ